MDTATCWLAAPRMDGSPLSPCSQVRSLDQQPQPQPHQGACYKRSISDSHPDLLNQNLQADTDQIIR